MMYLPELYYFVDNKQDIDYKKAILVTAKTMARFCRYYYVELLAPNGTTASIGYGGKQHFWRGLKKLSLETVKYGEFPEAPKLREKAVEELVEWIFANSQFNDLFKLYIDTKPMIKPVSNAKFAHHDDTCCWYLEPSEEEFIELQQTWRENGLPEDLFYPNWKAICILQPANQLGKFLNFETRKCYTPKQFQTEKNINPNLAHWD